jgi:CheY-like chemotaxis protein
MLAPQRSGRCKDAMTNTIASAAPRRGPSSTDFKADAAAAAEAARRGSQQSLEPPARVLVADDNVDAAVGLAMFLEALGYDVRTAHNGPAALDLARRWQPQAVFLDISMPLIDGDEVCRKLRQERWGKKAMIAAVTGFGMAEDRKRSFEAGFDHHLVKPVDPRSIIKLLQSL